jgi:hypothetical protein
MSDNTFWATQIALNLPEATWFSGLEDFDFLGEFASTKISEHFRYIVIQRWMCEAHTYSSDPLNCSIGDLFIPSSL